MAVIIFDFDGTIADSFEYVVWYLRREAGLPPAPLKDIQHLRGLSMVAIARQIGHPWRKMPRLFINGRREMRKSLQEVPPFKGMPEVIKKVHAEGHELFVLSNNAVANLHKFLHKYKLHTYFLEVYGGINIFGKAPALKRLMKENSFDVNDCVYVGDELRDLEASKFVKMRVIAVSWGFARTSDLAKLKPTALVHTPDELLLALEEV